MSVPPVSQPIVTSVAPAAPPSSVTATGVAGEWQEEQYIQSLAQLENIQSTITALRLTIPLLVRSLTRKHDRPIDLYSDFAKQTIASSRSIAELKALWESPELRTILAQVEKGVKERGFSIEGVGPRELQDEVRRISEEMLRYGWQAEAKRIETQGSKGKGEDVEGAVEALSHEEVSKLVGEFDQSREGLSIKYANDPWKIDVAYTTDDGMDLEFEIVKAASEAKTIYDVKGPKIPDYATVSETKLFKAVERCLGRRLKQTDLETTLQAVAAFKNLRSAKCVVCLRIIDRDGMPPAIRSLRVVKKEDSGISEWVATHEACVENVT